MRTNAALVVAAVVAGFAAIWWVTNAIRVRLECFGTNNPA
jgi:hypothetical protein